MSIFSSIMSKIFGAHDAAAAPAAAAPAPDAPAAVPETAVLAAAPRTAAPAAEPVDVEAVLTKMAAEHGSPSNWRTSIVDLMTLLGLDSSLAQRKLLADELGYAGDTNDSASMNVWLHKQVMTQLAANGGKVPDDLRV